MGSKRLDIDLDSARAEWDSFLQRFESLCSEAPDARASESGDPLQEAWLTENGDPIDPIAFFVTFTGIE